MGTLLIGFVGGAAGFWLAGWICRGLQRPMAPPRGGYCYLRRGSNPPPPGRKPPAAPAPDWRRSFSHENFNRPDGPPPLKFRRSEPIRFDEGHTQRGNGHGGPSTPKPPIKPQPEAP